MSQEQPFEPELISEGPTPAPSAAPPRPRRWEFRPVKVGLILLAAAAWVGLLLIVRHYLLNREPEDVRRKRELVEEYGPRFDELRQNILRLTESRGAPSRLEFAVRKVAVVSYDGLKNPARSPDDRVPGFGSEPEWSAVLHRWKPDELFNDPPEELRKIYDKVFETRYVLVVRITHWQEPIATVSRGEVEITPGTASADAVLLDLEVNKVVAVAQGLKANPLTLPRQITLPGQSNQRLSVARAALRTALHQAVADWLVGRQPSHE